MASVREVGGKSVNKNNKTRLLCGGEPREERVVKYKNLLCHDLCPFSSLNLSRQPMIYFRPLAGGSDDPPPLH